MNIDEIRLLFEYNAWADQRLLAAYATASEAEITQPPIPGAPIRNIRETMLHILNSERGWRLICQGEARIDWDALTEEDHPTPQKLEAAWKTEAGALRAYIEGLTDADLGSTIRYQDDDVRRERPLWHCLLHLANHGTQHRAEAAALLTACGCSPGDVDFTLFLNGHFKLPF